MLYAIGVRAIIDSRGLPEAVSYYQMFPREPGRTRTLDFAITRIERLPHPTLLQVMDHMIAAAGHREHEIMIVAHGEPRGLLMPVAPNGVSSMKDALRVIMNAATQLDRAAAIGTLPAAQRVPAWRRFIEELSPGAIHGNITEQEAVAWFNQWKNAQAHTLHVQVAALENLVNRMKQVRAAHFRRVEIRACNIGADPDALTALKDFFGARRVCAPNVGTFYIRVAPLVSRSDQRRQQWMRRFGRGVHGGVYAHRVGPTLRSDTVYVVAPHDELAFAVEGGFRILVWETSLHPHRYASHAFASEWSYVKAWVQQKIMAGSAYNRGNFVLAGMWTFGHGGLPFAVPLDPRYRRCIACAH